MKPQIPIVGVDRERQRRQFRIRTLMLAVIVAAAWMAAFRLPGVRVLVAGALSMVAVVAALFAGVMALGWLGFGLFAAYDRLAAWTRRAGSWPEPAEDWGE
jgi:hypothetical protein